MKKFSKNSSLLIYFIRRARKYFFLSLLFSFFLNFLQLLNPRIIGYTVDAILSGKEDKLPVYLQQLIFKIGDLNYWQNHLWIIAVVILVVSFIFCFFKYLSFVFNTKAAEILVCTMRSDLYHHILSLPYSWYSLNHTGDIIQRTTTDVETIRDFMVNQLLYLAKIFIFIFIALFFMLQVSWQLTCIAFSFTPLIVYAGMKFSLHFRKDFRLADETESILSGIVQENLSSIRVVHAFGKEHKEVIKFNKQNDKLTELWIYLSKESSKFWAKMDFLTITQEITILVMGIYFTILGWMSAGSYIAFIAYNALLMMPIRSIGRLLANMSKAGVALERLAYIMNSPLEVDNGKGLQPDLYQDIHFENVSYRYKEDDEWIVKDINLDIPKGTTIGILGSTGSGKSTLMYLLNRLYELKDGTIKIGKTDIKDINLTWLRKNVGLVMQEPYLFSRTLQDNICLAKPFASQEELEKAVQMAALDETIHNFVKGYDTYIGERGVTLSGGQKQRTAIAQMLIRQTPIKIFDDSLSAVDAETDVKIRQSLAENASNSTIFLITHRISSLMHADQIIVLDKGEIVQKGTHTELLEQEGIYRRIYQLQINQIREDE